jgi:hypothetical protein
LALSPVTMKEREGVSTDDFRSPRMPAVASVYHFPLSSAPPIPRDKCSLKMWFAKNPGNKMDRTIMLWCILVWLLEYRKSIAIPATTSQSLSK